MVVRYEERFQEMLAQAEVSPEVMRGLLDRLETFVHPFCASLASRRAPPRRRVPDRPALQARAQDRRGDRLSARPGTPADPEVHRPGRWDHRPLLATLAAQVGQTAGRARRRDRLRPLGLRQEGEQVGRRGAAVVRPARQGRELPGRRLHGIRLAEGTCARQHPSLSSPRNGRRTGPGARRRASPRRSSSGPATSWRWRCSTSAARCCRTPGSPATTRWAVRRGFAGNCGAAASATCWRSPRTR